jgi:hypothetical protein
MIKDSTFDGDAAVARRRQPAGRLIKFWIIWEIRDGVSWM